MTRGFDEIHSIPPIASIRSCMALRDFGSGFNVRDTRRGVGLAPSNAPRRLCPCCPTAAPSPGASRCAWRRLTSASCITWSKQSVKPAGRASGTARCENSIEARGVCLGRMQVVDERSDGADGVSGLNRECGDLRGRIGRERRIGLQPIEAHLHERELPPDVVVQFPRNAEAFGLPRLGGLHARTAPDSKPGASRSVTG
jgi:hypothetical protein